MKDWSMLRKMVFQHAAAGGSLTEYEVTGNPVSFQTNVAKPLTGFTIPFIPMQSGSGDPSPSNVRPISGRTGITAWRTGINVWDEEWVVGAINGANGSIDASLTARRTTSFISVVPGTKYIFVAPDKAGYGRYTFYDADKNMTYFDNNGPAHMEALTIPEGVHFIRITVNSSYGTTYNHDISFNYPYTDREYHAFTGASYPVTFPALGKNLFDEQYPDMPSAQTQTLKYLPIYVGDGAVTFSSNAPLAGSSSNLFALAGQATSGASTGGNDFNENRSRTVTPVNGYVTIAYRQYGGVDPREYHVQIEKGSSATAYEPYTNTVYGGTLDAVNGVLTVEWFKSDLSNLTWTKTAGGGGAYYVFFTTEDRASLNDLSCICNCLKLLQINDGDYSIRRYSYNGNARIMIRDDSKASMTGKQFAETLSDIDVFLVLAEPYEIQLDPLSISTLIGDNTIWSDTNGENTIKYKEKG